MAGEVKANEDGGGAGIGQKRQRRPSVRLGDLGVGGDKPPLSHASKLTSGDANNKKKKKEEEENKESEKEKEKEEAAQEQVQSVDSGELGMESGVGSWLGELGLGRYAPVFQIHEVDQQVLPLLTLDDLKDMGINAVGSRRKLYAAILHLRESLSSPSS